MKYTKQSRSLLFELIESLKEEKDTRIDLEIKESRKEVGIKLTEQELSEASPNSLQDKNNQLIQSLRKELEVFKSINTELKAGATEKKILNENLSVAALQIIISTNTELKEKVSKHEDTIENLNKLLKEKQEEIDNLKKGNDIYASKKKEARNSGAPLSDVSYKRESFRKSSEQTLSSLNYASCNSVMKPVFEDIVKLSCKKTLTGIGHQDAVCELSHFVRDGITYLISGSDDKIIKIWNLNDSADSKVLGEILTSSRVYSTTTFEIDGYQFCASTGSSNIEIWNLRNRELTGTLVGHSDYIYTLLNYESNGQRFLISGGDDTTIKLWNISSKICIHTFEGHIDTVNCLDIYEKDGKRNMVSGSGDKTLKLWSLDEKSLIATLTGHSDWINCVVVFYKEEDPYLVSGGDDKTIKIWNLVNCQLVATIRGHTNNISSLSLIPMEKLCLASGSYDKTIIFSNLENYTLLKKVNVSSTTSSITTFDSNGTLYLISGHRDGSIMLWSE